MLLHRSNSLEELTDVLARELSTVPNEAATDLRRALEPEVILIQSAGIQRYLSRSLATHLGVLAGARFPFPRGFIQEVFDNILGVDERTRRYEREALSFLLFRLLGEVLRRGDGPLAGAAFAKVRNFLARDADGFERYLLAERLAELFDQYIVYRPRLCADWEKGSDPEDFQAILFRTVANELGPHHFGARALRLLEEVSEEELRRGLPRRLRLIGGPGLPPIFLSLLRRFSDVIPVSVYSFTVCREYFGDAHPLREPLPEVGDGLHPLLASLGEVGAHYQMLLEHVGGYVDGEERFREPSEKTVLGCLQRDILEGRRRPPEERLSAELRSCKSVTLDVCHSPLREVEALKERLLGYFADDPTLRPGDIVVLTPKISAYKALIDAVFAARATDGVVIPFRIADQSERAENPVAAVFLRSLRLLSGRFRASEFLDVLQSAVLLDRFELSPEELERIAEFMDGAGFRFGLDGTHRASFGLPEDELCTMSHGLRRLLLGFAMEDDSESVWSGIVPYDDVSPEDRNALGAFAELLELLRTHRDALGLGRGSAFGGDPSFAKTSEHATKLRAFALALLAKRGQISAELSAVFDALYAIEERAKTSKVEEELPLSLVVRLLERELEERRQSTDFLAGGVTFCELLPLRTIPFRVVCLLGLGQAEFPRVDRPDVESKLDERPMLGDRSLRSDDKYLFLELLLCAKERLSLSYVGRSVQDNTEKPPSVLVSELAEVLEGMFQKAGERPFLAGTIHPLQPFSPRYFCPAAEPRAFAGAHFEGAQALLDRAEEVTPFLPAGARLAPLDERSLELAQLVSFFKNPAQAILRRSWVSLRDEVTALEDREPATLDGLERYLIGTRYLEQLTKGRPPRMNLELLRGELPSGAPGEIANEKLFRLSELMHERFKIEAPEGFRVPARISLAFEEGVTLRGSIDGLSGKKRLVPTFGQLSARRLFEAWVTHLAAIAGGLPVEETLLFRPKVRKENEPGSRDGAIEAERLVGLSIPEARMHLEDLVRGYRELLVAPSAFTPDVLQEVFGKLEREREKGKAAEEVFAIVAAACDSAMRGTNFGKFGRGKPGRDAKVEAHFSQLFGEDDPFGIEAADGELERLPIVALATRFWGPLAAHHEEKA